MRAGRLNKSEIKKLNKAYAVVQDLLAELPTTGLNRDEDFVHEKLLDARYALQNILGWQDRGGEWMKPNQEAAA